MSEKISGGISYCEEIRRLVEFAKLPVDSDTPVEIRIKLNNLPISLSEIGTHRSIEYEIIGHDGDVLIGGQGWSLDDAFKEAKQDFFDIIQDT